MRGQDKNILAHPPHIFGMSPKYRCSVCGSPHVMAKIGGNYYCFKCGSKIVIEHARRVIEIYKATVVPPGKT